jgi:hypothetical protein
MPRGSSVWASFSRRDVLTLASRFGSRQDVDRFELIRRQALDDVPAERA